MATIKATTAVDLTHLDFGAIFAARTGFLFQDNANVVSAGGVTYEDMLKLTLPGGSFSFGGAGLVVDSTGLLLNGGSITGLFGSSGGTAGYSIEGIFLSGTLVRNAAATPGTTDDDQQLASALGQADSFTLSAGNDRADGFNGNDTMRGGAGNDTLAGGGGRDSLLGGTGNDRLDGGGDLDTLIGGAGNDVYLVDLTNDLVREAAGEGIDTVRSSASTYTLAADVENLALSGLYAVEGIGNALGNTITGNAGNNRLWGMLGRDSLAGGAGSDTLNGGGGIDTMTGGGGNDVYALDVAGDVVVEAANGGNDTLITEVSWTLGANLENLQLGTTLSVGWQAHLTGNGNTLDNRITGGGGNNILRGGAGNDTLNGVIGLDTLVGGSGLDTFAFQSVNSPDRNLVTISDFVSADDSLSLNHLAFKKLGAVGALTAGFFHLGSAAGDGDDYLIYNTATGALFYDADGNGFLSQVQIGQFKAGTVIVAADLFVY